MLDINAPGDPATIAAVATPPGAGGIGVVRISGPRVAKVMRAMLHRDLSPRVATYCDFCDEARQAIDSGIAIFFRAPHSYTGEDVLELQGHGGSVVLDMVLGRVLELGVRAARAGEFSERAFLNQKLDLAQAEAVADIIDASSRQAARLAQRSLQGHFSNHVNALRDELIDLRAFIEAGIDFPDEEIDLLSEGDVQARAEALLTRLDDTLNAAGQGRLLREGIHVVLAGQPNVGKSSLLNAIVGHDRAIVTDTPGTTRDTVEEQVMLDGVRVLLTDTAGLRESDDAVEAEGIARTRTALAEADLVLFVCDAAELADSASRWNSPDNAELYQSLPTETPILTVWNKADLLAAPPPSVAAQLTAAPRDGLLVSAKTAYGVEHLCEGITRAVGFGASTTSGEGLFMARRRHIGALQVARGCVERAHGCLSHAGGGSWQGLELIAEELRLGTTALGEITGEFTTEALLGEIFSRFCIGK